MSTAAQNAGKARAGSFGPVIGNTARKLNPQRTPGQPSAAPKRVRTPLSVVPKAIARRRSPFAVFCFLALVGALATVLVLNISVSSSQYELVQLKTEQSNLNKVNQDLTQKVQNFQAPQNLVSKAQELGMINSTSTGQINVEAGTVAGNPKPATKPDATSPVLAAPALPGSTKPADAAAGTSTSGTATTGQQTVAPPVVPAVPPVDLRGGTVPPPEQKAPQK